MKPAQFEYVRPAEVGETLDILARDPDESKIIAGGQSLVPMMNFRLAQPSRLIDINGLTSLAGTKFVGDRLVIGALTRHIDLEHATGLPDPLGELLRRTARFVGHLPIRTRGTFGGSIAHSDSASEWCLLARLLDAEVTVGSVRGERTIPASDLFLTVFTTAIEPDELLLSVSLPVLDERTKVGIAEFARRAGDFAIVAALGAVTVNDDGIVTEARVCLGGVADVPRRSPAAEGLLLGGPWTREQLQAAAEVAAEEVEPPSDIHGDAAYRRDLVRALIPRSFGDVRHD